MVDPILTSALGQPITGMFVGLKLDLTSTVLGRTVCLLDGAGRIVHGTDVYTGIDDAFGTIDSVEEISDGSGESAPELVISLFPNSASTTATIANPAMQNCLAKVITGSFDLTTGLVIGEPEIKFLGQIDVPTLTLSQGVRRVEISIVSVFERLFENDDAVRASDGYHQSVWPGELGFEYMTGTDKNLYWGAKPPSGATSRSGFGMRV